MSRVLDVTLDANENNVIDIVFKFGNDASGGSDSYSVSHRAADEIYSEILKTFMEIKTDIFCDETIPSKIQHEGTTGPFLGFSNNYKNDNFKLSEVFATDYHGRICCEFYLRNLQNETSLNFRVGVPQYHCSYSVENLELNIGKEINLLPRGNLSGTDEKTSKRIIDYIKRNVYAGLEIPVANA